jgi:predicted helicase
MTEENTERVRRETAAKITVIIGNPPYNVGQLNENDNNKNRKYPVVDKRVRDTYAADSTATLKTQLYDAYVKFFRWATDRLEDRDGIVCFVSNNSFVDQQAFDGMQQHMLKDFTDIYHVDLHGNVRKNPKLSGTTHNVFGIQVGVGITVAVRRVTANDHRLHYFRVPENWRKEEKLGWLSGKGEVSRVDWETLPPEKWLITGAKEFEDFAPLATKQGRSAEVDPKNIFKTYSPGASTARDEVVYGYDRAELAERVRTFCENYNAEVDRYKRSGKGAKGQALDQFLDYSKLKWSRDLKKDLQRGKSAEFDEARIRTALYRPFTKRYLYLADLLNDSPGLSRSFFPDDAAELDNRVIVTSDVAYRSPLINVLASKCVTDLHLCASVDGHQCFAFYVYESDAKTRHENVTNWALEDFRQHYGDDAITKWDIFYYVYGILHQPEYRAKYAENLKRELPRIPLVGAVILRSEATKNLGSGGQTNAEMLRSAQHDNEGGAQHDRDVFWAFAKAGQELARLHVDYEKVELYPLKFLESRDLPLSYRVEDKMRFSKDRCSLKVNPSLTLSGIPPETFEYRLGNRSALEWVIDQYQVTEDKRSGIRSDPNRADDPEYIVRLVGQVIRVSLETVRIVKSLPAHLDPLECGSSASAL